MLLLKNKWFKIACTRKESVDENLVIDLIENEKLFYEQANSVLKERFLGVRGLSLRSVRRFYSKRTLFSRVSTEKRTDMEMEAFSKVISAFWLWCTCRRSSCRFFYYHFKIFSHLFYIVLSTIPWAHQLPLIWHF